MNLLAILILEKRRREEWREKSELYVFWDFYVHKKQWDSYLNKGVDKFALYIFYQLISNLKTKYTTSAWALTLSLFFFLVFLFFSFITFLYTFLAYLFLWNLHFSYCLIHFFVGFSIILNNCICILYPITCFTTVFVCH